MAYRQVDTGATTDIFLIDLINRKILRVDRGQLREVSLRDCLSLRVPRRRIAYTTPIVSSFAILHRDLALNNIIVDNTYNIKMSKSGIYSRKTS